MTSEAISEDKISLPPDPLVCACSTYACTIIRAPPPKSQVPFRRHRLKKNRIESKEAQERDTAQVLLKYNEEVYARGESSPGEMQVHRVKVVTVFLSTAVSLSKLVLF